MAYLCLGIPSVLVSARFERRPVDAGHDSIQKHTRRSKDTLTISRTTSELPPSPVSYKPPEGRN
eukprot:4684975-Amphidinium_carterae.1